MPLVVLAVAYLFLSPDSDSMPQSLLEVSYVNAPIFPLIKPVTLGEAIHIVALVYVPVGKFFKTLAMLQPVLKLSFVHISCDSVMDSVPGGHSSPPVSLVILGTAAPLYYFHRSLKPEVDPVPVLLIALELPDVNVSAGVYLVPLFSLLIGTEPPLVDPPLIVYEHS